MKDCREIKDLKYEVLVCMNNAYKKGYTQGHEDGFRKAQDEMQKLIDQMRATNERND